MIPVRRLGFGLLPDARPRASDYRGGGRHGPRSGDGPERIGEMSRLLRMRGRARPGISFKAASRLPWRWTRPSDAGHALCALNPVSAGLVAEFFGLAAFLRARSLGRPRRRPCGRSVRCCDAPRTSPIYLLDADADDAAFAALRRSELIGRPLNRTIAYRHRARTGRNKVQPAKANAGESQRTKQGR